MTRTAAQHSTQGSDTAPRRIGMWDDERRHPWRATLLYGLALAASLLASHCAAIGGAA